MTWHSACNRVNGISYLHTLSFQSICHFTKRMLGLCNRHTIAGNNNHRTRIFHDKGSIIRATLLNWALFYLSTRCSSATVPTKSTKNNGNERSVHTFTHNVRENCTRGADEGARDNQRHIVQGKADTSSRPA